jgi:hypothetical protein
MLTSTGLTKVADGGQKAAQDTLIFDQIIAIAVNKRFALTEMWKLVCYRLWFGDDAIAGCVWTFNLSPEPA